LSPKNAFKRPINVVDRRRSRKEEMRRSRGRRRKKEKGKHKCDLKFEPA